MLSPQERWEAGAPCPMEQTKLWGQEVPTAATYCKVWQEGHRPPSTCTTLTPSVCRQQPARTHSNLGEAVSPHRGALTGSKISVLPFKSPRMTSLPAVLRPYPACPLHSPSQQRGRDPPPGAPHFPALFFPPPYTLVAVLSIVPLACQLGGSRDHLCPVPSLQPPLQTGLSPW